MNIIKKNKKIFLGILIGTLFSGVGVYAATTYLASNVTYKDTTVEAALDELNKKDALYIKQLKIPIVTTNGGAGHVNFNTERYNTLTINSRTRTALTGTTYWNIYGYSDDECAENPTTILSKTDSSDTIEKFDISEYKCVSFEIDCTKAAGGTATWRYYYFNGITLSR